MRMIPLRFLSVAGLLGALGVLSPPPAAAQIATSLLNEGDAYPAGGAGHTVTGLNNTAVNHANGFAVSLNSSDGTTTLSHIWGNAAGGPGANIRSEGTFGNLTQTSYESFYGIDDAGSVCYSATGTGGPVGSFDSVWKDDTPLAVEGDPYPHAPNTWWRFGSRPGISADGIPYWVGGLTYTQGGSTQNYGLFTGLTGMPTLVGGDLLTNMPGPLSTSSTISFDYRFSALATHYIGELRLDGFTTSDDNVMAIDNAGLILAGTLVQEGNVIPVAMGGLGGEAWDNFDFTGITEGGLYFFTGDTDGDIATDEFILKNGLFYHREGDVVDGETLSGAMEGAFMNEDGDIAYEWDIQDNTLEALYLNDTLLLKEGDAVDFDGDGNVDAGAVLADFTGISALTLSDRNVNGQVKVYFTADIDTAGTTSTLDDVEGFYCMAVNLGPVPVVLSGLNAYADLRSPGVTVEWSTSLEHEHDGFHVYRSDQLNGVWDRLTSDLVRGQNPYSFHDSHVRSNTTYYYTIGAVDLSGAEVRYGPVGVTTPGWGFRTALALSRPNPFQNRTEIRFTLAADAQTRLTVFDVTGRQVARLVDEPLEAGEHSAWWDGRSSVGRPVSAGVYFYRLETPGFSQTRKVIHLRSQ